MDQIYIMVTILQTFIRCSMVSNHPLSTCLKISIFNASISFSKYLLYTKVS
jgi:hypothetical protein